MELVIIIPLFTLIGYWIGLKHADIRFEDAIHHINDRLDEAIRLVKESNAKNG